MEKQIFKLGIIAILVIIGLSMVSCSENEHELVGTWSMTLTEAGLSATVTLEFNNDGTGTESASMQGVNTSAGFTWYTSNSSLTMVQTALGQSQTVTNTYSISGNELTITSGGISQVFTRN